MNPQILILGALLLCAVSTAALPAASATDCDYVHLCVRAERCPWPSNVGTEITVNGEPLPPLTCFYVPPMS